MDRFYGALDLFALTSTSEGIPLTMLEAMAAGIPVVAPPVGGIPEVIEDSLSGYFYPAGNVGILAERIINIISEPGLGERMGMRGRKIVTEEFSARRFAAEQDKIYFDLADKNSRY
jgi:glycosyltransferase involved in cell wall biosynthesis